MRWGFRDIEKVGMTRRNQIFVWWPKELPVIRDGAKVGQQKRWGEWAEVEEMYLGDRIGMGWKATCWLD